MHAVWDVITGPAAGRSLRFTSEGETTVGRTDAADLQLAEDFHLSRVHFCVRYNASDETWYVRDLESRHGTFLNGERITDAALSDGDELKAGRSEFRIRTLTADEDAESAAADSVVPAAAAAALLAATEASDRSPSATAEYERVDCASGLKTLLAKDTDASPASIAWLLAREHPLFLLADFSKISRKPPSQLQPVDYVFNWMDDEVLPHCSPVLLGPADPIDPYEVIDVLWGQDAVVCLLSRLEKPDLLVRLRAAIRRDDGISTNIPKGILGYCWPEAVRAVLESAPRKLTAPLMECVTAILLEAEDLKHWQIFFAEENEGRILSSLQA